MTAATKHTEIIGHSTAQTAETHWHMHQRFCTLPRLVPTPLAC